MDLIQAIAELEAKFPPTEDEVPDSAKFVVVTSGDIKAEGQTYPALCNSEETAIKLWLSAVYVWFPYSAGALYWREKPVMETFRITLADKNNTQRLVSDRYAVRSRLWISETAVHAPVGRSVHVKADLKA